MLNRASLPLWAWLVVGLWGQSLIAQGPPPPPPPPPPGGGPPPPPALPPVPFTAQNPFTSEKAMLGKILFWETQLSTDSSIACGSCHSIESGGSDSRSFDPLSLHPGPDGNFGTPDDIRGSIGVQYQSCLGVLSVDPIFGLERQVTSRKAPSAINAMFDGRLFWDGRAGPQFLNPETGAVSIPGNTNPAAGALEAQVVGPIISDAEMGCEVQTWDDVRARLLAAAPLQYATRHSTGDDRHAVAVLRLRIAVPDGLWIAGDHR